MHRDHVNAMWSSWRNGLTRNDDMRALDISLERIFRKLIDGNVGMAIAETEIYLAAWPNQQTTLTLGKLKAQYQQMENNWRQGMKDPQRDEQYLRLLQQVYKVCANIAVHKHIQASSFLQGIYRQARNSEQRWSIDGIRREMESFVSDVAMLELEPEHLREEKSKNLYRQHQQQMNTLFNFIVTSNLWTDNVGQAIENILLSPTIDSNDLQLMTSAVSVSLMNCFDMAKFRILVHVYQHSLDEEVRQRALVGWVLGMDDDYIRLFPEVHEMVADVLQSKRAQQEVVELQMQFVYTLSAERDSNTIQQEIIPDILKNNSLKITRNGIEEIEEDQLEDVLHPDAAEQRMEKLEASFMRMMDMQKQGVDIYFGGFSQMKHYPFFYDMSNWMVPFYKQHPDIAQFVVNFQGSKFLESMTSTVPFCNSDKYSFVMAFQQVMNSMPENVKEMLKHGELGLAEMEEEQQKSPAYMRRLYLMDLYRFFRLFPNRSALFNPFDVSRQELGMSLFLTSGFLENTPVESSKPTVVAMLKKRKMEQAANALLATYPESMQDVQYYLWKTEYAKALELEPDNERALVGHARQAYDRGDYREAEADHERLHPPHPEKKRYMLNRAICLVEMGDYEEATRLLYQLNYEQPENTHVSRALAWALTCDGKQQQAEKIYQQLTTQEDTVAEDFLNMGYCLWLQDRIGEAAQCFRRYIQLAEVSAENFAFKERSLLRQNGISDTDILMMETLTLA